MKKPIIGITLDWEDAKTYSSQCSWYALRDNYISSLAEAGAVPLLIPYDNSSVDSYISLIDGLVIPGGDYDLNPESYNAADTGGSRTFKQNRVNFEEALLLKAIEKKIPILGICAGMQLINVKFGGSLIQDIQSEISAAINHEQKNSHHEASHTIEILDGSLLHKITGTHEYAVNSTHHQAVKVVANDFIVSAKSKDGIIEAIEHKSYPFLLGVEWHPEYGISEYDRLIFKALVKATGK